MNKYSIFIIGFILSIVIVQYNKGHSRYSTVEQLDFQQEFKAYWDYPLSSDSRNQLKKIINNYQSNLTPIRKKMIKDVISDKELIILDKLIKSLNYNLEKNNVILELSREEKRDFIYFHNKKILKYLHKLQASDLH